MLKDVERRLLPFVRGGRNKLPPPPPELTSPLPKADGLIGGIVTPVPLRLTIFPSLASLSSDLLTITVSAREPMDCLAVSGGLRLVVR